jgi:hypothetical protein
VGMITGVVVGLGRGTVVGVLSRNVFLVGGFACPTMLHYAPLCIHWFRLACELIGARVNGGAGWEGGVASGFMGGLAGNIAGALGFRGEEARGFFLGCTAAAYRARCLSSTESALSTPVSTSTSASASSAETSLAAAEDVDTVTRYARGDAISLPLRDAFGGWIVDAGRSLLVVGASSSSGIVITRSMIFGSDVVGEGVDSTTWVFTGGWTVSEAGVGIRLAVSAIISPSNFFNAS